MLANDIPPLSMTLFIQQNSQLPNVGKVMSRRTCNGRAEGSDGLGEAKMGSGCYTVAWYDGMFDSSFSSVICVVLISYFSLISLL